MMGMGLWAGLDSPQPSDRIYGVVIAYVTNTKDPEQLGRVKVRFPWLSDEDESDWARVLTPMAGNGTGIYFLPSVGDEVLVAFEQGMVEFPYILGGLWSRTDKPPETNSDGKNNLQLIHSRSGHIITLDDTKGSEKITIQDKSKNNKIVIDTANNSMTLTSEQDLTLEAKGTISLKSSSGDIKINGNNLNFEAQQNCKMESSGGEVKIHGINLNFQAQQSCEMKANVKCAIESQAGMAIKCLAGVKINDGALEVT